VSSYSGVSSFFCVIGGGGSSKVGSIATGSICAFFLVRLFFSIFGDGVSSSTVSVGVASIAVSVF
jgi:hypothetical protein